MRRMDRLHNQTNGAPRESEERQKEPVSRPRRQLQSMLGSMVMMACCLLLILISGTRLVRYIAGSVSTRQTNAELQALHDAALASAQPTESVTAMPTLAPTQAPTLLPTSAPTAVRTALPTAAPTAGATLAPPYLLEYQTITTEMLPELAPLYRTNRDLIGWLAIDGVLNLPVVYRNNTYYMDHDFYGVESAAGTVFLDENHPLTRRTQHLLLYGHNMKDGSMFGHLTHYRDRSYYLAHAMVDFATLYDRQRYVIFAVMQVSVNPKDGTYVNFAGHSSFATVEAFDAYMQDVRLHSMYQNTLDVNANDALLTMSTCYGDDRLVLVARRLRDGESEAYALQQLR